ncbi:unnamed protein product [Dibothriocephalus latus]|uniref:Uncharacterized protein n=1 Tax=Dibothriocephalus latus TaxID=60516 RepID=A0A3P7LHB9_DIBLA|nr:unnamed protein product [Dibothriocephalus latus]
MKDAVSSTPQANTTLKRGASRGSRAAAAESVSKAKKTRVETSPPAQPLSVNPRDTKTPRGPKSVEAAPSQPEQLKTPVRKTPPASAVPVLNQTYKKPNKSTNAQGPFVGLTSPTVALFGDTQHTPPKAVANPAIRIAKLSLPKVY